MTKVRIEAPDVMADYLPKPAEEGDIVDVDTHLAAVALDAGWVSRPKGKRAAKPPKAEATGRSRTRPRGHSSPSGGKPGKGRRSAG